MKPVVGAMAILFRDEKILMIRRSKEPDAGRWSFPAGKIETGETICEAVCRELVEETGLSAHAGDIITAVDAIERESNGNTRFHFVIIAVSCHFETGELVAGDGVREARWVTPAEAKSLDLATGFDVLAVLDAARLKRA